MRLVILTKKGGSAVYINPEKVSAVHTLDGTTFIEIDTSHYTSFQVEESEDVVAKLLIDRAPLVSAGPAR